MENDALRDALERVARGDVTAFSTIYKGLEKPLHGFLRTRLRDPSEISDVVHETFMDVWRNAAQFQGRSSVKSWVFSIAYRKSVDLLRKQSRILTGTNLPDLADGAESAEARIQASQSSAHLRACIGSLKKDQRVALNLAYFEGLTYREIAKITNAPEGTVKTRIFHAKQALMHRLDGQVNPRDFSL